MGVDTLAYLCKYAYMKQQRPTPADCCRELRDIIPVSFFKALCEPNRLLLVQALVGVVAPGRSLSELAQHVHVDLSVTSRHCAILKGAGIVSTTQMGRETRFFLEAAKVAENLRLLANLIEKRP